jgi:hypothetical protein
MRNVVDLPAPFGPTSPYTMPFSTRMFSAFSAM